MRKFKLYTQEIATVDIKKVFNVLCGVQFFGKYFENIYFFLNEQKLLNL